MIKNQFAQLTIILLGFIFSPISYASEYGPVAAKETLWSIASRHRPNNAVTTQQVMLAIRRANPNAFQANNINALRAGSILRLPSINEIRLMGTSQALEATKAENSHWKSQHVTTTSLQKTSNSTHNLTKQVSSYKQHYQASQRELAKLQKRLKREKNKVKILKADINSLKLLGDAQGSQPRKEKNTVLKITALEQVIKEKNEHIAQLENMKIVASETIKRQLANNEVLYNKLKSIDPQHVMDLAATSGSLELKSLDESNATSTTVNSSSAEESNNVGTWLILLALVLVSLFIFYIVWNMYRQYRLGRRMRSQITPDDESQNEDQTTVILSSDRKEPQLGT
jgi:FimV-like protein